MKPSMIALAVIFGIVLLGAIIGICSGRRRQMNLEQWTVAGRGFGVIFVWLLMAGEAVSYTHLDVYKRQIPICGC